MITGQMRTYEKCFSNILNNVIKCNQDEYHFDIYIQTEYYGSNGGTAKNKFTNTSQDVSQFKEEIQQVYGHYLKELIIENKDRPITYPTYLNNYGPWLCLYKNKILFDHINQLESKPTYDMFIRMRPDIHLTNRLDLNSLNLTDNIIHIISGKNTRNHSWLHNRDWDHINISDFTGMELWCDYYKYLEINPPFIFDREIRFNNVGYWAKSENKDKSIITTQLFFKFIAENNYTLRFDSGSCFSVPIR